MSAYRATLTAVDFDSSSCVVPNCPSEANPTLKGPFKNKCDHHADEIRERMREAGGRASKNATGQRFGRYDGALVALGKELLPILRRVEKAQERRVQAEHDHAAVLSEFRAHIGKIIRLAGAANNGEVGHG